MRFIILMIHMCPSLNAFMAPPVHVAFLKVAERGVNLAVLPKTTGTLQFSQLIQRKTIILLKNTKIMQVIVSVKSRAAWYYFDNNVCNVNLRKQTKRTKQKR